jgi:hypothetical protein
MPIPATRTSPRRAPRTAPITVPLDELDFGTEDAPELVDVGEGTVDVADPDIEVD